MREIKFRAYNIDRKLWDYFVIDDLDKEQGRKRGIETVGIGSFAYIEYVKEGLRWWGQYTGMKDKNGKEIYESDYLERPEVNDNSKSWCVFWGSGKYILQNISTGDILDCNEENTQDKEIVGNRYQNPREHKAMASDL